LLWITEAQCFSERIRMPETNSILCWRCKGIKYECDKFFKLLFYSSCFLLVCCFTNSICVNVRGIFVSPHFQPSISPSVCHKNMRHFVFIAFEKLYSWLFGVQFLLGLCICAFFWFRLPSFLSFFFILFTMAIFFVLNKQRIAFYLWRAIGDWKAPYWLRFLTALAWVLLWNVVAHLNL